MHYSELNLQFPVKKLENGTTEVLGQKDGGSTADMAKL